MKTLKNRRCLQLFNDPKFPVLVRWGCFKCFRVSRTAMPYRLRAARPAFCGITSGYRKIVPLSAALSLEERSALDPDLSRRNPKYSTTRRRAETKYRRRDISRTGARHSSDDSSPGVRKDLWFFTRKFYARPFDFHISAGAPIFIRFTLCSWRKPCAPLEIKGGNSFERSTMRFEGLRLFVND